MNNTKLHNKYERLFRSWVVWLELHQLGRGALVLFFLLAGVSALASVNLSPQIQIFLAGEVATTDIVADHGFLLEDNRGTRTRTETLKTQQPLICDLTPGASTAVTGKVTALFSAINAAATTEDREKIRVALMDETGVELSSRIFAALTQQETQQFILTEILPWVQERLTKGIISDVRLLLAYKGGVLVRDLGGNTETLYSEAQSVPDLSSLLTELAQLVRSQGQVNAIAKRSAIDLLEAVITPTLSPNYEMTKSRIEHTLAGIAPVMYQVQKGELIVRQGEIVSNEQQLKIHKLYERKSDLFRHTSFIGTFLCALLIASGLFFSPSGKIIRPVRQKDLVFIGVLVTTFAVLAKATVLLGQKLTEISPTFSPDALAFLLPVAGAAGLSALVFSTRWYLVTGLLLAFFCSIMYKGSLPLFLFYFLSAMLNTWLIARTQTRQDVVASIIPLLLGLFVMWASATFMQGGPHLRYFAEAMAVLAGGIISMFLIFALAPLIEMCFGYSTRFKLMELMNLDQPILRELMLNAPGTYHHSLIVAHLVEAGAKSIGAQSLLCKVAALYHDIGKISRPDYFIENQFSSANPHDRLSPSMSALILTSHVKKGVELAKAHHLGQEVMDIIRQHHGTSTIQFFFQKAKELGENPKIEDFSYPGPSPQNREAALVMLADIIEASSRTLGDPTPNRLQTHIQSVLKNVFASGQLDEADLTFKDLEKLTQSFLRVLTGLFHHRIKYPDKVPVKPEIKEQIDRLREANARNKQEKSNTDPAAQAASATAAPPLAPSVAAGGNTDAPPEDDAGPAALQ